MSPRSNQWMGSALLATILLSLSGCTASRDDSTPSDDGPSDEADDDLRGQVATISLALDSRGRCVLRSPSVRVAFGRTVRLKNVGDRPIVALVELWDNLGGMPAPEGGDIAPGKYVSVKMTTRWWQLGGDDASREWSTAVVCRRGPWSDDSAEFREVARVQVYR